LLVGQQEYFAPTSPKKDSLLWALGFFFVAKDQQSIEDK
jgi:hypothetical protein